jgi:hypothetical protein
MAYPIAACKSQNLTDNHRASRRKV